MSDEVTNEESKVEEKVDIKGVVSDIALDIWKDLVPTIPDVIKSISAQTDVALQGKYKEATEEILRKMAGDLVAFKDKEIDRIEFEQLIGKRKAAIFAFFNANKISHQKPSIQKILDAVVSIATTILVKAVPALIVAAL